MTNREIREKLITLVDEKFRDFSSALTPGEQSILGVRVPLVKELAKEIAKGNFREYLKAPSTEFHEECLLYGLTIGFIKADIDEVLAYFDSFVKCVKNWAVCDSSVMGMKILGKAENKAKVWDYLTQKLNSTNEPYTKRVVIVAMFCYFLDDEYIERVAEVYEGVKDEHYYVKMALAWGISVIAVKNYAIVLEMLNSGRLGKWVQNKGIQKSCESFRLTPEQKTELKKLKSNL